MNISLPDPFGAFLGGSMPVLWNGALAHASRDLYLGLFALELVVIALRGLLFKDSLEAFVRGFAGKVVLATLMIALIANAATLFPTAINLFSVTATTTLACPAASPGCMQNANAANAALTQPCLAHLKFSCVPPRTSNTLESLFLGWAATYFLAADASRVADSAESAASGILFGIPFPPDPGNGTFGLPLAFLMGHVQFQLACMALGMLCVGAAGGLLLTFLLLTFEAQIVLALGVLTLALYGSRFTTSFGAAFPRYCVSVGVKFFAFYFVVATLQAICAGVNFDGMLAALTAGAGIPFGLGSIALLFATTSAPLAALVSSAMIFAIPQFAASLLRGSPALSASAVYSQFAAECERGSALNHG